MKNLLGSNKNFQISCHFICLLEGVSRVSISNISEYDLRRGGEPKLTFPVLIFKSSQFLLVKILIYLSRKFRKTLMLIFLIGILSPFNPGKSWWLWQILDTLDEFHMVGWWFLQLPPTSPPIFRFWLFLKWPKKPSS